MKLVFLDLDGTVIGSDGAVSEPVRAAIREAKTRGVDFRVCTGRTCAGIAEEIAEFLNPDGFHVFESGAVAMVPVRRDVLFADALDSDDLNHLVKHARSLDALLELYTTTGVYVEETTADGIEHGRCLQMPFEVRDFDDVVKNEVVIRGHWIAREHNFDQALAVKLPNSYVATAGSPALPTMRFASVTRTGTNKGIAVSKVMADSNLNREVSYGVGDTMGDLSMLEAVGHAFVMANADAPLLEMFPTIGAVSDDGVAKFLNERF